MKESENIVLALSYWPPYAWGKILKFFEGHAITGVETVKDNEYMRTVYMVSAKGLPVYGWFQVANVPEKNMLRVILSESLLPVLPKVLSRIQRMFDLYCNPYVVFEMLKEVNTLKPKPYVLGTRVPGCFNAFEMSVRAVLDNKLQQRT